MIFRQTTNSNFEFVSKRGVGPNDLLTNFRHKPCAGDGGATCSMPRVSGIDDAHGISAHNIPLSNSVVQVMLVWSLPALHS